MKKSNAPGVRKMFILIAIFITLLIFAAVGAVEYQKHETFYTVKIDSVKDEMPGNSSLQQDEYTKQMKEFEEEKAKNKLFQDELKALLLKDGYIKDLNNIKCVSYGADGIVKVCGAKISKADRKKYQELHHRYFNKGSFHEVIEK